MADHLPCGVCGSPAVATTEAQVGAKRGEVLLCPEHAWPVREVHPPFWLADLLASGQARLAGASA